MRDSGHTPIPDREKSIQSYFKFVLEEYADAWQDPNYRDKFNFNKYKDLFDQNPDTAVHIWFHDEMIAGRKSAIKWHRTMTPADLTPELEGAIKDLMITIFTE